MPQLFYIKRSWVQLESEDELLQTGLSEGSCQQTVAVAFLVPALIMRWLYDLVQLEMFFHGSMWINLGGFILVKLSWWS